MQISYCLDNKDFRCDSDFYTLEPQKNKKLLYKKIGECIKTAQYGISIEMNENGIGIPIYRMNEIHNQLCDRQVKKFADITNEEFNKFKLNNKDVLFNRTNSYDFVGRTGIYYKKDNAEKVFASYLVRFVCKDNIILPEYLTAYLNTTYGICDIRRRSRQSINQTNVNPEEVKEFEIPILSMYTQKNIQKNFEKAYELLIFSQNTYRQAKQLLLSELDLDNFTPSTKNTAVKTFADVAKSGRLDAEYYQAKYDEIEKWIKFNDYITVFDVLSANNKNFLPLEQKRYKYIELANVENYGCINDDCIVANGAELPTRARRKVKTDDVIISSVEGSLDSCALITEKYDQALCSTGFYIMRSKEINAESLLLLFKSEPIRTLMKRGCSGTILSAISSDELKRIPLPVPGKIAQQQIAAKVRESFALREESKRLLKAATRAVEIAIEDGEDAATAYLAGAGFGYDFVRGD